MTAVFCVVGKKKSGKTTTVVGLVEELVARGYRVATAKHGHAFELDREGKDSFAHRRAGAALTLLSGPEGFAMTGDWPRQEEPLETLIDRHVSDVDIVIAEGFKTSGYPRVEVYRTAAHTEPFYGSSGAGDGECLAVLTDASDFSAEVPVLDLNDPLRFRRVADLMEARMTLDAE